MVYVTVQIVILFATTILTQGTPIGGEGHQVKYYYEDIYRIFILLVPLSIKIFDNKHCLYYT